MPHSLAELDVVDVIRDRRALAADRTGRVSAELHLVELAGERVVEEQATDQGVADPEHELERLGRLDRADHSREDAEHPALGAARRQLGWRRLRKQTAITRPVARLEDGHLA